MHSYGDTSRAVAPIKEYVKSILSNVIKSVNIGIKPSLVIENSLIDKSVLESFKDAMMTIDSENMDIIVALVSGEILNEQFAEIELEKKVETLKFIRTVVYCLMFIELLNKLSNQLGGDGAGTT